MPLVNLEPLVLLSLLGNLVLLGHLVDQQNPEHLVPLGNLDLLVLLVNPEDL